MNRILFSTLVLAIACTSPTHKPTQVYTDSAYTKDARIYDDSIHTYDDSNGIITF